MSADKIWLGTVEPNLRENVEGIAVKEDKKFKFPGLAGGWDIAGNLG